MGKLNVLTQRLLNEPQLITHAQYAAVADYLNLRNSADAIEELSKLQSAYAEQSLTKKEKEYESAGVGVLNISGALSHKASIMEALCGGASSYQSITKVYESMVADSSINTIVLDIDSGGGEARGCFDFAQHLRAKKGDKKLIARTDSLAASAAYAIASVADEVIISRDADVGSIGVISQLVNYSGKLEKEGVSVETFTAGKGKDIGNPTREMTESEMEWIQSRIDELYSDFVSHVAEMRNLDQDFIIETLGAATFRGQDAVDKGLADKVMTNDEFATYLLESKEEDQTYSQSYLETQTTMSTENITPEAFAKMQEQLEELKSSKTDLESKLNQVQKEREELAKADLKEKAEAWAEANLGVDVDAYATAALKGSIPVEMFNAMADTAAEKLKQKDEQLDASAGLSELGDSGNETDETPKEEAAARQKALLENKYKNIKA